MSYQDPWQSRRAAKDARRAAKYAYKAQRQQNKYAYRSARRAYRGRPGGRIVGMVFLVLLLVFIFTHIWAWLVTGIIIVAGCLVFIGFVFCTSGGGGFLVFSLPPKSPDKPPPTPQPPSTHPPPASPP